MGLSGCRVDEVALQGAVVDLGADYLDRLGRLDEGVVQREPAAGPQDPCNLGWAVSSIRAVGNEDFLDDNPDIRRLLDVVSIPLSEIAAQNARMAGAERGYSEDEIQADAAAWIEDNRDTVDGWLATARG